MKRISLLLALLCLLGCVTGCGSQPEQPSQSTAAPTVEVPVTTTEPVTQAPESTAPTTKPVTTEPPVTTTEPIPTVTEPKPTEPKPTEPKPTEPKPTEPKPTEPKPTKPEKTPLPSDFLYSRAELEAMNTKVNGYGPGVHMDENNRPYGAINEQKKYGKYDALFILPDDGKVYLTFDEGYENGYTARILDVLKEKNVHAVFFVTMDYCKKEPELVQRMIDEGHVVGNHSVRHKSMPTLDIDTMISEVMGLHEYVLEHFGYEMTLFRPPMGEYSEQSLAVLQCLGYRSVNWSFAYYDYDPADQPNPTKAYNKIVNAAHGGAIYLLHAVSETNTEILGDVIDAFREQGYPLELLK